jgi:hypothetical protein
MDAKKPTPKQIEDAIADAERRLAVDIGDAFLRKVNMQAHWRGIQVREFVVESILLNCVEMEIKGR